MLDKKHENAILETRKEFKNHLPPWEDASCKQKIFAIMIYIGIYIPVIILWMLVISFMTIYIIFYIYPSVHYISSPPALYYYHTSSEYLFSKIKAWVLLGVICFFLLLFISSTIKASLTKPGEIPLSWAITSDKQSEIERRPDGHERICIRCELKKPDRAHHCRQCEKCTLRMDHHCNWIGTCIGFWNYKYFICMVFHGTILCLIFIASFWETLAVILNDEANSLMTCLCVVLSYSIVFMLFIVLCVFLIFHLWLISKNYTTIEYCEKRSKNSDTFTVSPYSMGTLMNFKLVLGENPLLWFIPTTFVSKNDGTSYVSTKI